MRKILLFLAGRTDAAQVEVAGNEISLTRLRAGLRV